NIYPNTGVYGVLCKIGKKSWLGAMNIGKRPTIAQEEVKNIHEIFLFDCEKDLYEECVEIFPLFKVRDEMKFEAVDDLKKQISQDVVNIKSRASLLNLH